MELEESKSQAVRDAYGFLKQSEYDALKWLVAGSRVVVNIGAGVGTSGLIFRETCGQDAEVFTIDNCEHSPFGGLQNERNAFLERPGFDWKLPVQIFGDSEKVGMEWTGPKIDFVFVDGGHSEEQCRLDIEAWLPHMNEGGIMAFHDYVNYPFSGVIAAVDDLMSPYKEICYVDCLKAFRIGRPDGAKIVQIVQNFIDRIEAGERRELPDVKGYSSAKVRNLLNMLVGSVANHYLEIGVHLGSTFVPAVFGNTTLATCIDNWSRFGNLCAEFEGNLDMHGCLTDRIQIIEQDCWTVDLETITAHGGLVDVYFYDGDHEPKTPHPQYLAIDHFLPILAGEFVYVCDDANYPGIKEATYEAIKKNNLEILKEWLLPGPYNGGPDDWWNGLLVMVLRK